MSNLRPLLRPTFVLAAIVIAMLTEGCATSPEQSASEIEIPVFPPAPDQARFYYEQTLLSSADVLQEEKHAPLRRLVTGEVRTGQGMGKPFGVAVHQGRIFVSDTQRRMVMIFDPVKSEYLEIGTKRPGELFKPLGLDVDEAGNLFVCDGSARHVVVFDRMGNYVRTIGEREDFVRPSGIAVNPEGTRVYVVDTGGVDHANHHVLVYDANTGEHLYNIGKRGSNDGEFNLPRDATIGADALLYVVDGGNFRVQAFHPDGTFVKKFGDIGRRGGQFSRPKSISADAEGNLYIADAAFGNFQIFNANGQLLLAVGKRSANSGPATFMLPAGITVDEDGRVYMVDQYFRKVDIFRPAAISEKQGYLGQASPAATTP